MQTYPVASPTWAGAQRPRLHQRQLGTLGLGQFKPMPSTASPGGGKREQVLPVDVDAPRAARSSRSFFSGSNVISISAIGTGDVSEGGWVMVGRRKATQTRRDT